jgi:transposase InsO family protein
MTSEAERVLALKVVAAGCAQGLSQAAVCRELGISQRTYRRWAAQQARGEGLQDRRRQARGSQGPGNRLSDEERQRIVDVCNQPEFRSLPPTQIVPILADRGIYLGSESTFYRVLRQRQQLQHRGRARAARKVSRPRGYRSTAPNQVWSWDITYLATSVKGAFYRLYLVEDVYSRKIVGWEVHPNETSELAAQLIEKACLREAIHRPGLVLHSDNGSPMKGATMLSTMQRLGIVPSFSRPSVSDDNPYSESLFRTLKYVPHYPTKPFDSLEAARRWVGQFVHWYNEHHRHSAIGFVTPGQRHRGEDKALLQARDLLYKAARAQHPNRWSGDTRDWRHVSTVWLNPPKQGSTEQNRAA